MKKKISHVTRINAFSKVNNISIPFEDVTMIFGTRTTLLTTREWSRINRAANRKNLYIIIHNKIRESLVV